MTKEEFKTQVMMFLAENGVVFHGKIRTYNTRRNGLEVRFYGKPMEIQNTRNSRRRIKDPTEQYNCTYGKHSRIFSNYIYINEYSLSTPEEREFTIQMFEHL